MKVLKLQPDSAGLVLHDLLRIPNKDGLRSGDTLSALDLYLSDQNVRHFSAWEVVQLGTHKGVTNTVPTPFLWPNIVPTIHVLEWLRQELGDVPITVTSGYRSVEYNRAVGGAQNSLHRRFNAIDFKVQGFTPGHIAEVLETTTESHQFGIGSYDTFTHLDTRGLLDMAPARWDERRRAA